MLTPGLKLVENNQAGANPNNLPEIVHFPDTNQVMAYGKFSNGIYDKK